MGVLYPFHAMRPQALPASCQQYSKPPNYDATLLKQDELDDPITMAPITSTCDGETTTRVKPLLSGTSSFFGAIETSSGGGCYQQNRRRQDKIEPRYLFVDRSQSFRCDMRHAAAETFLVTRLSFKLLRYLGVGYRWIMKFLALGCYSLLLMPGFIQVGYYYFFSNQVLRSIVYGSQPRNRLDLYLPKNNNRPKPVVAFVTGGAWIIGYKAWGCLLGQQLSDNDVIVACIDYRNFPQGTISDMVKDVSHGISFVSQNIADYGGDPNRIYLMGQSAGAHIAACVLMEQAINETSQGENVNWSTSSIKSYIGLSGGYNLFNLVDYFHCHGLYRSIFLSIMEGEESLRRFSPEVLVQDPKMKKAVLLLPPIFLCHGTSDYSIPADASKQFGTALERVGVSATCILYEGKTHTDLFLQDPMRGGKDQMFEDLLAIIHADDVEIQLGYKVPSPRRRLVPEFMLKMARGVSPF